MCRPGRDGAGGRSAGGGILACTAAAFGSGGPRRAAAPGAVGPLAAGGRAVGHRAAGARQRARQPLAALGALPHAGYRNAPHCGTPAGSEAGLPSVPAGGGEIRGRGSSVVRRPCVSLTMCDIVSSMFMACLVVIVLAGVSTPSGSTRPLSWRRPACRRRRPRVCWPGGSGARRGRLAGMRTPRRGRAGSRSPRQPRCSRSSCRCGWRSRSASMPECRGARSPPWWHRRWRSSCRGVLPGPRSRPRGRRVVQRLDRLVVGLRIRHIVVAAGQQQIDHYPGAWCPDEQVPGTVHPGMGGGAAVLDHVR
jgi:hypothetical protein